MVKPKKKKLTIGDLKEDFSEVETPFDEDEDEVVKPPKRNKTIKGNVFGFVIDDLNSINAKRTYDTLKSKIKLGKDRLNTDVLSEAIDEAPQWAFQAAQLHSYAKEQLHLFENFTYRVRYAELAEKATEKLEKQRKAGKISGQITKEKIENWIIINEPEYSDLNRQFREYKTAVEIFAALSSQFESKKSLLQTQGRLAASRSERN